MCYTSFTGLFSPSLPPIFSPVRAGDIQMCIKEKKNERTRHLPEPEEEKRGGPTRQSGVAGRKDPAVAAAQHFDNLKAGKFRRARARCETFISFSKRCYNMSINIKQRRRRDGGASENPDAGRRKTEQVQFSKVNRKSRYF